MIFHKQLYLILILIFTVLGVNRGQTVDTLVINNHADCPDRLKIETRKTIGPTTSPNGYGKDLEFSRNARESVHFMEKEGNTVWYEFKTKTNGKLTFEIEPLDSLNDYDFALYRYTDKNFCPSVKNKTILPVRTNFSRNNPQIGSKTGLKTTAKKDFISAGVNPAYSNAIDVQAKETYVLLVNNVYPNGKGHLLHFNYLVNLSLNGQVVDVDEEGGLNATVTLTNTKTGAVIAETISDSMTGAYKLIFDLPKSQLNDPLHLEIMKDNYFFHDTIITAFKIATKMQDIKLKTAIKKLKKGDRFVVSNILFHGDSPEPLTRSMPSIKALFKTMKRNKKLKISIEGHTNGCSKGDDFSLNLSNARAATVYNYLVEHQISKDRLSAIGYGCEHMLHPISGRLAHLNRRVEIEIVELGK